MFDKKATRESLVQKSDKWHTLKVKSFDLFVNGQTRINFITVQNSLRFLKKKFRNIVFILLENFNNLIQKVNILHR